MNIERAQEILNLEQTIDVKLGGVPVWIDNVDPAKNQVTVHVKNKPDNRKTVSADQLQEV